MAKKKRIPALEWLEFHMQRYHPLTYDPYKPRLPVRLPFRLWLLYLVLVLFLMFPAFVAMCWLYWTERDGVVLFATIFLGLMLVINLFGLWNRLADFLRQVKTSEESEFGNRED
mgnify:CR=1 FL=1